MAFQHVHDNPFDEIGVAHAFMAKTLRKHSGTPPVFPGFFRSPGIAATSLGKPRPLLNCRMVIRFRVWLVWVTIVILTGLRSGIAIGSITGAFQRDSPDSDHRKVYRIVKHLASGGDLTRHSKSVDSAELRLGSR